ncbi:MAG: glycosyltransferase [Lachnospiraceae bacterium]|nr:glycosyltransferase [Lachnospiraceae bacterium]
MNNFFEGMNGVVFAHIYNSDSMPINNVCNRYFQISERESFKSFFTRKKVGRELTNDRINRLKTDGTLTISNTSSISKLLRWVKNVRPEFLISIKLLLRRYCNWRTPELNKFILDFNPDVIYAPCYASPFQLALTRHVKKLTGKKMISWSADDNYSLRQLSFSPFYWINRFWNRHCLRKTYPCYDEFYSISEDEINEMSPIVGKQMKVLRKGVVVPESFTPREVHTPVKFIYAGGLYCNRFKSLIKVANAIQKLNMDCIKAELHIYTGSKMEGRSEELLNDGRNSFVHGLVTPEQLTKLYLDSDVAIHCESFDIKYRLMTRLSFSTKIIDCFQSGCAILAIAWSNHTGLKYLQKEDAAICVSDVNDIESTIAHIVEHPELIKEYARKAYECEKRNHRIEDVQKTLYDSFIRCSS